VTSASKAIPLARLKRRALSLGAAKAFDQAMQFLLPVVLVRCLDTATFGEYRLLWLAVGTLMYLATFNMPQSLYFFLPRSDARLKRLYINQTILFMSLSGLACAWLVSPWNPWTPAAIDPLLQYGALVPAFVALTLLTCVLDFLPTVDERIRWQAVASISLATLRVVIVGVGAFFTGSMEALLWLLLAFVLVRLGVLVYYVRRFHGLHKPLMERALFGRQVRHAAPIGMSNALFGMRWQADQWIAAHLFSLTQFAAFSISGIFGAAVNLFRTSVNEAFLPSMSRLQAAGDVKGMLELNGRANVMVGTLLFPMLAFGFVFAEEVVTVIYTASYLEAAPVMRIYIVAFCVMVIEMGSLVLLLNEGRYALAVNVVAIAFSVAVSLAAALHFGLPGAALGGVLAIYLDRFLMLRRIARRTGIPLRQLQDWRGLALALGFSVACAAIAWHIDRSYLNDASPLERLIAGGGVLAAAYGAVLLLRKARKG
jgi:O-antigen/teichoic acid export membrane protein